MAQIKTYARIKPTKQPSRLLDHETTSVSISVPQLQPSGQTRDRTATLTHHFGFAGVFGPTSTQEEVFDLVASHIVDGFLSGYNGTIFAYGQTGSGKTFTIEGGARTYSDRGLAPRALSRIYKSLEKQKFDELSVKVSYLEIYQEVGYDLLNPTTRPGNVVTHLPKVTVTDGPDNSCAIRNLSTLLAADERVAQTLLLQGQANRKVAETPMNQRSSRSHAVFTIYLRARLKGSDVVNKSKLHLVDLAGSERVAKTKLAGQQLHEAKSINLSLHHLEGVIIALQNGHQNKSAAPSGRRRARSAGPVRNRRVGSASSVRSLPYERSASMAGGVLTRHIPYRNSLLTMVLRDSLGGNCLTAMVATVSADDVNLSESLSTCRFAMRVAAIHNKISRNEIIDDRTIITRLRKKVLALEDEITRLKRRLSEDHLHQQQDSTPSPPTPANMQPQPSLVNAPHTPVAPANGVGLNREGRQLCARLMQAFVSGKLKDPISSGISDFSRFRECLRLLREMILRSYAYHQRYNPSLSSSQPRSEVKGHEIRGHQEVKQSPQEVKKSPEVAKSRDRPKSSGERGSSRVYQSPFERKKEREISRLGKKVETRVAEQQKQRRDLMEFRTMLKQQQLENVVRDLGMKIDMARDHLGQQRGLVQRLRECKASREQITAERIAEKQLAKKLAKYEKQYQVAQEHLQIVNNHIEFQYRVSQTQQQPTNEHPGSYDVKSPVSQSEEGTLNPAFSLEASSPISSETQSSHMHGKGNRTDRSQDSLHVDGSKAGQSPGNIPQGNRDRTDQSQDLIERLLSSDGSGDQSGGLTDRIVNSSRHKSGKVNARHVLDVLQMEDRKQRKIQKEIEKERIKNFTQHYALKEEATLSKLRHFKEQLKKQQESKEHDSVHASIMREPCDHHVQTSWSGDDVTHHRSATNQSETAHMKKEPMGQPTDQSEKPRAMEPMGHLPVTRTACGDHVSSAWTDATHQEPFTSQSKSLIHMASENHGDTHASDSDQTMKMEENPAKRGNSKTYSRQSIPLYRNGIESTRGDPTECPDLIFGSIPSMNSTLTSMEPSSSIIGGASVDAVSSDRPLSKMISSNPETESIATISSGVLSVTDEHSVSSHFQSGQSRVPSNPEKESTIKESSKSERKSFDEESLNLSSSVADRRSTGLSVFQTSVPSTQEKDGFHAISSRDSQASNPEIVSVSSIFQPSVSSSCGKDDFDAISSKCAKKGAFDAVSSRSSQSSLQSGSFDAALAAMLHQDKPGRLHQDSSRSRDNQSWSGSGLSLGSLREKGSAEDVTSTLKSKLLGYLGGKPNTVPKTLFSKTSTPFSSTYSLQPEPYRISDHAFTTKEPYDHHVNGSWSSDVTQDRSTTNQSESHKTSKENANDTGHATDMQTAGDDHVSSAWTDNTHLSGTSTFLNTPTFDISASTPTLRSITEEESIVFHGGKLLNTRTSGGNEGLENAREVKVIGRSKVKALEDTEGEKSYLSAAKENKARIKRIRKSIRAAEIIQKAWRKHKTKTK